MRTTGQSRAGAVLTCVLAWSFAPLAAGGEDEVVYTRADVVTAVAGEAALRRAYVRRLALPAWDCPGEPFACTEDRTYAQVYSVSFVQETVDGETDGVATVERRDRGQVSIAVDFSKEDEASFEDTLAAWLEALGPAAYARPWAGMRYLDPPLEQRVLARSAAPVWVCTESEGTYTFQHLMGEEGRMRRSSSRTGEIAATACRAIERAVEGERPETYRTMPDIRAQIRREVRLRTVSTLEGLTWADRLAALPEGVTLEKASLTGGKKTGATRDRRDGAFVGHEGRYGDVERNVRLSRASLDLVAAPMWVARWTFEAAVERFGEDPRIDREPAVSLTFAVAPIPDPRMAGLERAKTPLSVPDGAVIAEALTRLARSATLGPDLVLEALADPEVWPAVGDWLVLTCREDGTARYGIAPFPDAAEIANPRETCAAVRREIGD